METTITRTDDRFSFKRMWMVARFHLPTLKWQLIIYGAMSIVCSLISAGLFHELRPDLMPLAFVPVSLLWYLYYLGPAIFGISNGLEISTILPARNSEKATFVLLYCFVVTPVVLFVPSELIMNLTCGDVHAIFSTITYHDISYIPDTLVWFSLINYLSSTATCLFIVMTQKRHRVLKAIGFTILYNYVVGFATGLVIGIMGFYTGFKAGASGCEIHNPELLIETLFSEISPFIFVMMTLLFCYLCAMLVMICRSFSSRQI